jgi:transforming growth factor-beta-induced protein
MDSKRTGSLVAAAIVTIAGFAFPAIAKDEAIIGVQGGTAEKQDIINTLKQRGAFHTLLDGYSSAYNLDNELKGKGPYTVFAPDDKAWAKMPEEDRQSLFANNKRLRQVLTSEIVKGQNLDSTSLKSVNSVKCMDGRSIAIASKQEEGKDEMFVDKAKIKKADIECSNGIIHIIDTPIMPPLAE